MRATAPAAGAIFDYFDFWVCPQCGRTLLYANQEAGAKADGGEVPKHGLLGLS
jgi:hypothetical protein